MASFREHIAFSSLLGIGYGAAATWLLDFTPVEGTLAGFLAGMGGMLPDLDSPSGRPGREIFSLMAAAAPLMLIGHALRLTGCPPQTDMVMMHILVMYFLIRYGLAWLVDKVSVHRGMFHSIPAMGIAAEAGYLAYPSESQMTRLLMGCAVAVGFFSHLFLDEVYSIKWKGPLPTIKKSFGTAIKFVGNSLGPTAVTYALLATLTFLVFEEAGLITPQQPDMMPFAEEVEESPEAPSSPEPEPPPVTAEQPFPIQQAEELTDAPLFR